MTTKQHLLYVVDTLVSHHQGNHGNGSCANIMNKERTVRFRTIFTALRHIRHSFRAFMLQILPDNTLIQVHYSFTQWHSESNNTEIFFNHNFEYMYILTPQKNALPQVMGLRN